MLAQCTLTSCADTLILATFLVVFIIELLYHMIFECNHIALSFFHFVFILFTK